MQPVTAKPLYIRMHADDNVAIVANGGGLHAGHRVRVRLAAGRADPARPQGCARRHRRRRSHSPLRRGHRSRRSADRRGQLGQGIAGADARRAVVRRPADAERRRDRPAAAGRLHLRRLSQCRRLGRHPQHPRDLDQRAMRRRHGRVRGGPDRKPSCCRNIPTSTTWWRSTHAYGCGVAIDAPDAAIPIRTLQQPQPAIRISAAR